jgi:hypothetical protein
MDTVGQRLLGIFGGKNTADGLRIKLKRFLQNTLYG